MLTPRFKIAQDRESLTFSIYAPFTNLSSTTIHIEGDELRFFSTPYYLRLHLSGNILEDKGYYDADSNSFIIRALKECPGEDFAGLDKVTSLLTPSSHPENKNVGSSKIEELDNEFAEVKEEDPLTWLYPQEIRDEIESNLSSIGYGFAFEFTQVYSKLPFANQILDVHDPDTKSRQEIREERLQGEREDFSDDHYLCDLHEPPEDLKECLQKKNIIDLMNHEGEFTKEEIEQMISLPRKNYLIEKDNFQSVYLGLLDILLAYHYDMRITEGEHCSESGWTICKLCATLTCSEKFTKLNHCISSFFRRSLTYPLFRHYELSLLVLLDVAKLFKKQDPITPIVKILLDIIPILNDFDERYIFNQIYIQPYATWIQTRTPANINSLGHAITKTLDKWNKKSVDLDLVELETAAELCTQNDSDDKISSLIQNVKRLELKSDVLDSDDNDGSASEDESSSEDSETSSSDESEEDSSSDESETSSSDESASNEEKKIPEQKNDSETFNTSKT